MEGRRWHERRSRAHRWTPQRRKPWHWRSHGRLSSCLSCGESCCKGGAGPGCARRRESAGRQGARRRQGRRHARHAGRRLPEAQRCQHCAHSTSRRERYAQRFRQLVESTRRSRLLRDRHRCHQVCRRSSPSSRRRRPKRRRTKATRRKSEQRRARGSLRLRRPFRPGGFRLCFAFALRLGRHHSCGRQGLDQL